VPTRSLPDYLEAYLEFTKNTESPISYHTWAAIGSIAAALERKVWMKWGHSDIYPNQYIILVGPPGARKGEPIMIAQDMMAGVGVALASQKTTPEALAKDIAESMRSFQIGEELHFQCPLTIVSEEMAVFLGNGDTKFLADLTNWYDSRGEWTYRTKHSGTDQISGVCVNIVGSMAPDWIPLAIPPQAIGGGFTSRIIWVVEHAKGRDIPDPNEIGIDAKLQSALKSDLEIIHSLVGEFRFEPSTLEIYKDWYKREESRTKAGRPAIADPRLAGYVARRATHVKKISMAMSASRSNSLVIMDADLKRAMRLLEAVEARMSDVFGKVGLSMYSQQTHSIIEFIRTKKIVTKSDLMQVFYRDVDSKTMDIIEATLRVSRFVEVRPDLSTGEVIYKWIKD
jgi:hypothetical protein